jgi:cytoskeletal protein RodZ
VSVGEDLARAREGRGMSVEDVSSATRIRAGLIRSIEADDFDACGGAVYARGHLRSIARAIGVDPDPLVAEFDSTHQAEEPMHVPGPNQLAEPDLAARADRHPPNWTAAMAAALVAICLLAAYGLIHKSPTHPVTQSDNTPATTPATTPPTTTPPTTPPTSIAQVPSNLATALVRVSSGPTWLQVETLTGRLLFQGLLSPGQTKVFRDAKGLRLVIGNAPAVQLVADSHDFGTPQSSGNVAHVTIQPGGDVQFA